MAARLWPRRLPFFGFLALPQSATIFGRAVWVAPLWAVYLTVAR